MELMEDMVAMGPFMPDNQEWCVWCALLAGAVADGGGGGGGGASGGGVLQAAVSASDQIFGLIWPLIAWSEEVADEVTWHAFKFDTDTDTETPPPFTWLRIECGDMEPCESSSQSLLSSPSKWSVEIRNETIC